jgi:hypothetical protein
LRRHGGVFGWQIISSSIVGLNSSSYTEIDRSGSIAWLLGHDIKKSNCVRGKEDIVWKDDEKQLGRESYLDLRSRRIYMK